MSTGLELIRAANKRRTEIRSELIELEEKAVAENRDYNDEEKATLLELRSEGERLHERISANLDIEVRSQDIQSGVDHLVGTMLDRESGEVLDTRSVGERFVQTDGYADWAGQAQGKFYGDIDGLEVRAVTDATTGATSGGAFIVPTMLPRVAQSFLDRRVYLSDLLPRMSVSTGSVEYVQDISPLADIANKAAETTEDTAKPQAGLTTQLNIEPIATIPAWVNITRQIAADLPQIQGYLDGRLRYSLKRRLDIQVISGNGTLPNIKGLQNRAGIVTYAPGAPEMRAVSIRHSITLMEAQEAVPEIVVLNPADAELFDLTNQTTAGIHAATDDNGGMTQPPTRTAWGLTQVHSNAIASGTAMLLDPTAVSILDRMQPTAYMTDSHASNFTSNILTLLLELRAGLALFAPSGICVTTFNGTT